MRMTSKYYHTLKHLKPVQIYGRIFSIIKRPLTSIAIPSLKSGTGQIKNKAQFISYSPQNIASKISMNEFTFLNQTHSFGQHINWQEEKLPLLWSFNLHYFAYLSLLSEDDKKRLIYDWIEKNPVGSQPGWHPYTLSLRIVNWVKWAPNDETDSKKFI